MSEVSRLVDGGAGALRCPCLISSAGGWEEIDLFCNEGRALEPGNDYGKLESGKVKSHDRRKPGLKHLVFFSAFTQAQSHSLAVELPVLLTISLLWWMGAGDYVSILPPCPGLPRDL